jgi:hypothetical protein
LAGEKLVSNGLDFGAVVDRIQVVVYGTKG